MLNFQDVNSAALAGLRILLSSWLPGGVYSGNEYKATNPTRDDKSAGSFSINVSTGSWADFATNDRGGDPISLYAYIKKLKQSDACRDIAKQLGIAERKPDQARTIIYPAPDNAPAPPTTWGRYESQIWVKYPVTLTHAYRTPTGGLYGYVVRMDTSSGKETVPLTAWKHESSGAIRWHQKSFPKPRPIYAQDRLAHSPQATVIIVEGEKCADALQGMIDGADAQARVVATTWPGGAKAVDHADFSPLRGRTAMLWPDNDSAGTRAMDVIAERLSTMSCRVKIIGIPADKPEGWDVADAILIDRWDFSAITAWIKSSAKSTVPPATPPPPTKPAPTPTAAAAPYGRCVYDYGNSQKLNQSAIANEYIVKSGIVHDPCVSRFYLYEQSTGMWIYQTDDVTCKFLGDEFQTIVNHLGYADLVTKRTASFMSDLCRIARGIAEQRKAFQERPRAIHVANCMLEFQGDSVVSKPFSRDYYSRNRTEIKYQPGTECPRFLGELLAPAVNADDISLIQRYVGQCLLGDNPSQTFLVLRGTPGGGKGTLTNMIEHVVGLANTTELRMDHLGERFEIFRYVDKTLLCGKDVPGTFLNSKSAHVLKALVGGDLMSGEAKHGNDSFPVRGNFNAIITTNTRLRVKLDSDLGAWRRRILIVDYENESAAKPIPHLDEILIREEGPGILAWAIAGAIRLQQELREFGRVQLSQEQQNRIDDLLYESDAVSSFVRERIAVNPTSDLSTTEITTAYRDYCEVKGWDPVRDRQFQQELPEAMLSLLRVHKSRAMRNGKFVHGYANVGFINAATGEPEVGWD